MYRFTVFLACLLFATLQLAGQNFIDKTYKGARTYNFMVNTYGVFIQNGIEMYKVTYTTPDVFGQLDTASGLLLVPIRDEATIAPLLVYQHGTVDGPQDVPSNLRGGYELASVFAGMGYVTLAPDYLGAGESRGFHPYVHASSEASAAVDMVRAFRAHAPEMDVLLNDQLFVTGYSQGGHASMALHKVLEEELSAEMPITAAAHMSGPYSISGVMREVILAEEEYFTPAYLPNTYLSYNYVYDLYDSTVQMFKPEYVDGIDAFFRGEIGLFTLNSQLISQLRTAHGGSIMRYMLQDSIVDILSDPSSNHPLIQALQDNDLYDWPPNAPTAIFYCQADDQVHYRNSVVADSVMQLRGAVDLSTSDVNPAADHGGCVEPATFQTILHFGRYAEWLVNSEDLQTSLAVVLAPNPVQEQLVVSGLTETTNFKLFTSNGKMLQQGSLSPRQMRIDLSRLSAGLYFLQLNNTQGQTIKQVVVD